MQRYIEFALGEYYHIYNRGVEKRKIFVDKNDWTRFHKLLYIANSTKPVHFNEIKNLSLHDIDRGDQLVAIGTYVLMPNHFHILVKEIVENGLSKFMEKLTTAYSMYFNKKNERVGALFQGTFKAEHADSDEYLKYLYAYIHLNPIKLIEPAWKEVGIKNEKNAMQYLNDYRYSGYIDYCCAGREEASILSKNEFPKYFSKSQDFKTYVNDWLTYRSF